MFPFFPLIEKDKQCPGSKKCRNYLRYGDLCSRDQQLVCPKALDPESSDSISDGINCQHLAVKFFVSGHDNNENQQCQVPQPFI